jgi:SAM-dependent methyltransferase
VNPHMERLLQGAAEVATAGAQALDAGCGDGAVSRRLAALGYRVLAIDRHAHPDWRDRDAVTFQRGDIREVPLAARAQLVCLSGLLHYFSGPGEVERVLRKWSGFVLPGGRLIANWIDDSQPYTGGSVYLPGAGAVAETLRACGLSEVEQ